jgi:uncharacterized protein (TIGR04255 family)
MNDSEFKLPNPPIVEAVLDIECDLPPGQKLTALEGPASECFRDRYPKKRATLLQQHQIVTKPDAPPELSVCRGVQAFQFVAEDEKQLVQVRVQGFSFNRLAPYTSLDDYLPEMERTWRLYLTIAAPVQVRVIRLRYINRIMLPTTDKGIRLEEYLRIVTQLPDEDKMTCVGFLNQITAVENETGHHANIVLTVEPLEGDKVPIIFDNCVASPAQGQPEDWAWLLAKIQALRGLKNRTFRSILTERCLNLFRQP